MSDIFNYNSKQLHNLLPGQMDHDEEFELLCSFTETALRRYKECVASNNTFKGNLSPDPFNIMQYPIFLYLLSRVIYESGHVDTARLKDRIHALNKALHGWAVYFTTKLPIEFHFTYATGIVLAPAQFGNRLVIYQGVAVTANNGNLPLIGINVTLMPGVLVSGKSVIGNYVTVSAGTRVIDREIKDDSLVFQGSGNELIIKDATKDYSARYFHN